MSYKDILKMIDEVESDGSCVINGCQKPVARKKYKMCEGHYYRLRKHGDPLKQSRSLAKDTIVTTMEEFALINLTNGGMAIIDKDDVDRVIGICWSRTSKVSKYVRGYLNGKSVLLHRHLMDAPKGMCVDHINHDPLDNRKSNLRICTKQQNLWNLQKKGSNRFKGVSWHKPERKWRASICKNGKRETIGLYDDDVSAALAYDLRAVELFGDFAKTNNPIIQAIAYERGNKK